MIPYAATKLDRPIAPDDAIAGNAVRFQRQRLSYEPPEMPLQGIRS